MNAIQSTCIGIDWAHQLVEMVMADVTDVEARWIPPGAAHPVGAVYAHALISEDAIINGLLRGGSPLYASSWAGKVGVEHPQMNLDEAWSRALQPDLDALREYSQAVAAARDEYLGTLTEADLDEVKDLTQFDLGQQSVGWILNALVAGHLNNMAGELSCLKGLQGKRGYPF